MRLSQFISTAVGAAIGGTLLAGVGSLTHLELAGAGVGLVFGAAVGAAYWAGRVSTMTLGGIVGAIFVSTVMCPPTGIVAPWGFLIGYCVIFVLRGIWRPLHDERGAGVMWLWIAWAVTVVLWLRGGISGLVPAYGGIFLLALEAEPVNERTEKHRRLG